MGVGLDLGKLDVALLSYNWMGCRCHWLPLHWPRKCLAPKFAHILASDCSYWVSHSWCSLSAGICIVFVVYGCSVPLHIWAQGYHRSWGNEQDSVLCRVCTGRMCDQATWGGCTSPAKPMPALPDTYWHHWPSHILTSAVASDCSNL